MKRGIVFLLLLFGFCCAQAQMYKRGGSRAQGRYSTGRYASNAFIDNWDVSFGVGLQSFCPLPSSGYSVGDALSGVAGNASLGFNVSLSKWLLPSFGVRVQAQGLDVHNYNPEDKNEDNPFSYLYLHADAMINLTHVFLGYKPDAFYSFSLIGGFGWASLTPSSGVGTGNEYAASGGMLNRFRINDALLLTLECKVGFLKEISSSEQDKRLNGNSLLWDATFGLTYCIPTKRDFDEVRSVIRFRSRR